VGRRIIIILTVLVAFAASAVACSRTPKAPERSYDLSIRVLPASASSAAECIISVSGSNIGSGEYISEMGVCWSSTNSLPTVEAQRTSLAKPVADSEQSLTLTSLEPQTLYYVRPYVLDTDGSVFYGSTRSVRTLGTGQEYYALAKGSAPTEHEGYRLVWHDEFELDGKPSNEWTYEKGFQRNNELQWYQEDNASVSGGTLIIEGRSETVPNPNYNPSDSDWRKNRQNAQYTSSCITTQNSFHFRYGRMEVRAKIPVTSGAWPAIWTLGNMWDWPNNGEIDIMEFYIKNGGPSILANACWGSAKEWTAVWDESVTPYTHFTATADDWDLQYHIWRMDWDESFIRLYLDDELLNEVNLSHTRNAGWQGNFENPFSNDVEGFGDYILLNLAIGSNGGTPDTSFFPLKYYVDYVRVYQK
jgi:beta-glucanase (GH16 family)